MKLSKRLFLKLGVLVPMLPLPCFSSSPDQERLNEDLIKRAGELGIQAISNPRIKPIISQLATDQSVAFPTGSSFGHIDPGIGQVISAEFENGQTVVIEGFVYAPSEIAICITAALMAKR